MKYNHVKNQINAIVKDSIYIIETFNGNTNKFSCKFFFNNFFFVLSVLNSMKLI